MGKLSFKCKVSILISWALVLTCSAAKQDYFLESGRLTWEQARNHCQVCFKELVTLTPENIQTIAKNHNVTSDSWIGLRKNLNYNSTSNSTSNSASNSSMSWSRWANGDPLVFQNWYPGWPVFRTSLPKRYCCTCPAATQTISASTDFGESTQTVPASTDFGESTQTVTASTDFGESTQTVTASTDFGESTQTIPASTDFGESTSQNIILNTTAPTLTTQPPAEAGCVPILDVSETDTNYIDDSCVAMLSFGAWVEKDCLELLPFICYDDLYFGPVNLTSRTSESSVITWPPGPGNISHYRIEVSVDKNLTEIQTDSLTYDFVNLTAGTRHSVHVFPVKCGRDLNPQDIVFYTTPNKVSNLEATNVTETSVHLSWNKPDGNVDFYLIKVHNGKQFDSKTESQEVAELIPGNLYTFTVISGVEDKSTWSEETSIIKYTKPGKVSDLTVSNSTENTLLLNWVPPKGTASGFRVVALSDSNHIFFDEVVTQPYDTVTGLPMGTTITLSVTALTNGTNLQGDNVTAIGHTAPGPVSNLVLNSTHSSLTAKWSPSEGNPSSYTVELELDGKTVTEPNITQHMKHFDQLKNAANYTVTVYAFSGRVKGPPVRSSIFTKPTPPTDLTVIDAKRNQITFQWKAPVNIAKATYSVKINSSFWGYSKVETLNNKTTYTSVGLKSGTRYDFEVRTVADEEKSDPETVSHCTEADKREIGLSMMCSSAETLLCDKNATRTSVFEQLKAHFNNLLGDNIFWELHPGN